MKKVLLFTLFAGTLCCQGCVPLLIGAAAGGTGVAVYRRNGIANAYDDSRISDKAMYKIHHTQSLKQGTHIVVATKDNNVLLAGQVPFASQRVTAERTVRSVPGVRKIYNEIEISGPTSALTRSSDAWITSKVKGQIILSNTVPASHVKVVTENGTVYLMGDLNQKQAAAAINIARRVSGVQKVITLFQN